MSIKYAMRDLVFGVQALRRQVERDSIDLFGALGVAAEIYPHQVGVIERVLSATQVRHLLADEVGMGKTIEALMILNALRLQSPGLRTLIVVPNHLRAQWARELQGRAHERPADEDPSEEANRHTRLVWPERISPADIAPDSYDLLIVDEFHSLTEALQRRIRDTARRFSHLLLVSATPPFHVQQRLDELMSMLEPSRAALIRAEHGEGVSVSAELLTWDRRHARYLEEAAPDKEWGERGAPAAPSVAAEAHCAYRRIVRSRREDYPEYIPSREHVSELVEPVEAEVQRQVLMWRYMKSLGELSREFDRDRLAQRVIRSAASLRQRVTYLRGHGHEREGLLASVAPLLGRESGDSRRDALCELLNEIWSAEPKCKVLVAAGDNLTVDALAEHLPALLGPGVAAGGVRPVRIRNQTKGADAIEDEDEVQRATADFVEGGANLMLAANVGRLGLNLQVTRHLVLYSVPWDPEDVEQWIGRVDRLGNTATSPRRGESGRLPIRIYTIAQRGQVDERILQVLEATTLLTRSISLDSAAVKSIAADIRAAVFGGDVEWSSTLEGARRVGRRVELSELGSPLLQYLPYTPVASKKLASWLKSARPVEPAPGGADSREEAIEGWLKALNAAEEYDVRGWKRPNSQRTLGYKLIPRPNGGNQNISRVTLDDSLFEKRSSRLHLVYDRSHLQQVTPQREVIYKQQGRAKRVHQLHFLNHGSPLHESLVDTWVHHGGRGDPGFGIKLAREHPASSLIGKTVVVRVYIADPANLLDVNEPELALSLHAAVGARVDDPMFYRYVVADLNSDRRFLRSLLPKLLVVQGASVSGTGSSRLPQEEVMNLLRPTSAPAVPMSYRISPKGDLISQLEPALRSLDQSAAGAIRACWAGRRPALERAVKDRLFIISADHQDEEAELSRVTFERSLLLEGSEVMMGVSRRRIERQLAEARLAEQAARAHYRMRASWLEGVVGALVGHQPTPYREALIEIT